MKVQINLNGDSRETLVAELTAIMNAAGSLIEAAKALTVNGRNYPQGGDDYAEDRAKRAEMIEQARAMNSWAVRAILRLELEEAK